MESDFVQTSGRTAYEWARQSLLSMQLAENYYRNYMDKTVEIVKPVHTNWRLEFEANGAYGGTEKLKAFRMAV